MWPFSFAPREDTPALSNGQLFYVLTNLVRAYRNVVDEYFALRARDAPTSRALASSPMTLCAEVKTSMNDTLTQTLTALLRETWR